MRFAVGYPLLETDPAPTLLTQQAVASIAAAAERAGFSALSFTEHPATPDAWRADHGHDAVDPFVGLAFAAAATTDILLQTYLAVVPYHQPFLLAKTTATLDRFSGGRLILGVGTGYLRGEFAAVGADFDGRNARFEEAIEVMRAAWTGLPVDFVGSDFVAESVVSVPMPTRPTGPPIWIGGNAALTRRRVAQWGDGWMPIPTNAAQQVRRSTSQLESVDQLRGWIRELQDRRSELGRIGSAEVTFRIQDIDVRRERHQYLDRVDELSEAGVDWIALDAPDQSCPEAVEEFLGWFGEEVIQVAGGSPADDRSSSELPEIARLHHLYADLLDRSAFSRLGEVFTEDVVAEYEGNPAVHGLADLIDFMEESHRGIRSSRHRILDLELIDDGGDALVAQAAKRNTLSLDGGATVTVAGRYVDELVRTEAGLRIAHRSSINSPLTTL